MMMQMVNNVLAKERDRVAKNRVKSFLAARVHPPSVHGGRWFTYSRSDCIRENSPPAFQTNNGCKFLT